MSRIARVVAVGFPHHVTQRGNRRQDVFFEREDYVEYISLLKTFAVKSGTEIWAYCLMTNHVHLIMVPSTEDGLRASLGEAHRRYTNRINRRYNWRGHLWQERFSSFPMGQEHLAAAARYIELNPVHAGIVTLPQQYEWSSVRAHLAGVDDELVKAAPLLEMFGDWARLLESGMTEDDIESFRKHEKTGRPMGGTGFLGRLEELTTRKLLPQKPGPKRMSNGES